MGRGQAGVTRTKGKALPKICSSVEGGEKSSLFHLGLISKVENDLQA